MSDESDREEHTVSSEHDGLDGDEDSSDQSGSEATNPLLDMEAVESDGETGDEMASEFDEAETHFFPQFCRLPIELRERIWECFDPNLTCKARVFDVTVVSSPVELWDGPTLDQQTEPARAMLATHRESRTLALKRYPDILYLHRGKSMVHFNASQDIVGLSGEFEVANLRTLLSTTLSDCGVKSIALERTVHIPDDPTFKVPYMSLEDDFGIRIYQCFDAILFSGRDLQPFVSDSARKYYMRTREEEEDLGEDFEYMYCWNPEPMGNDYAGEKPDPSTMIKFCFTQGLHRFDKIRDAMSIEGPWEDKWESDSENFGSDVESEVDEYELDGFVVNSELDESEGSDNDDDDDDDDDEGNDIGGTPLDDNVSSFNGFSPLQHEDGDMGDDRDLPAAHFSSLEPESPRSDDLEDQDVPESGEQPVRSVRTFNRRIISSDDASESEVGNTLISQSIDDEDVLELGGRPGQRTRVKRRIASSGDEDEDEDGPEYGHEPVKKARPHKRARVIVSDSEDDADEEGDGRPIKSSELDDKDRENSQGSSDSATEEGEEEEEEEDSDEESVKAKPVSLLARLRRFKSDNPVSPSESDGKSVGSEVSDGTGDDDEDESNMDRGEIGIYADMDAEQDYDEEENEDEW